MLRLLQSTAVIEASAGLFLLVFPSIFSQVLLGVPLDTSATLSIARIGGAALLTLALNAVFACFDANSVAAKGFVRAMVFYNGAAAIVIGVASFQPAAHALITWSGAALHNVMTAWCVGQLVKKHP